MAFRNLNGRIKSLAGTLMQARRTARRIWPILALAPVIVVAGATAIRLRRASPSVRETSAVAKNSPSPLSLLAEADRYSSLFNFSAAYDLYGRAEREFEWTGDRRNAEYARIGRLRAEFGARSYEDISRDLEGELRSSTVQSDTGLKLWCLAAKGYTDLMINTPAARKDWEQVLVLAQQLSDKEWANRADGELGIVKFLEGDWRRGAWLVGKTFFEASSTGDIGSEIRYLEFIGAALNEVNRQNEALYVFDRAIELAPQLPSGR